MFKTSRRLLSSLLIIDKYYTKIFVSATRRSRDIKYAVVFVGPRPDSKQRPWTHAKVRFYVLVCKTGFTEYRTFDTINGFRDSVLVSKMCDCYCTIRKKF